MNFKRPYKETEDFDSDATEFDNDTCFEKDLEIIQLPLDLSVKNITNKATVSKDHTSKCIQLNKWNVPIAPLSDLPTKIQIIDLENYNSTIQKNSCDLFYKDPDLDKIKKECIKGKGPSKKRTADPNKVATKIHMKPKDCNLGSLSLDSDTKILVWKKSEYFENKSDKEEDILKNISDNLYGNDLHLLKIIDGWDVKK